MPDVPTSDIPDADVPDADVPDVPKPDVPKADVPDVPKTDVPKADVPDVPKTDVPKADVPDVPKADVPKADVPKTDVPNVPKADVPKADVPKAVNVKADVPDVPKADVQKADVPKADADGREADGGVEWARRWLVERGGALVLVVLVAYLVLAPAAVVDGDNAELSTVGALGGRPHPSGYPAYVLWLRLTSWLPGSTAAHTAAIATVLLGVAAVAVLHAACRAWGARPATATIACAIYAASPVVLRMHTEAEVFAGNALAAAAILWLAAARGPARGVTRAALLGLVAGLALGNHLTCALLAPIGILGLVRGVRETKTKPRAIALALAGLALGLATYLYLYYADGDVSFGRVDSVSDVVAFFLRKDYGGAGAFAARGQQVSAAASLGALADTLSRGYLWIPGIAGVAMLVVGTWRDDPRDPRSEPTWGWRTLLLSFVLAGPVLATLFNIAPTGLGRYVVQRFHLLALLLLAPAVAVAADRLLTIAIAAPRKPLHPTLATVAALVGFAALVVIDLPRLAAQHSPAMERAAQNLLTSLPPNSVMLANSEDTCIAGDYLQRTRALRTDVTLVCWPLTSRAWYRQRLHTREHLAIRGPFTPEPDPALASKLLASSRPVFVDRSANRILTTLPSYPYGLAVRVVRTPDEVPPLADLVTQNRDAFAKFVTDFPHPGLDDDWATLTQKRYAATWKILADALARAGNSDDAIAAARLAATYAPGAADTPP